MKLKSKTELAKALGVNRTSLIEWSKRADAPKSLNEAEWKEYLKQNFLGPYRTNKPETEESTEELKELKLAKLREEVRALEYENDLKAGVLVEPTEMARTFSLATASINSSFENLIKRSSVKLIGLTAPHQAEEILRDEVIMLTNQLRSFDFDAPVSELLTDSD